MPPINHRASQFIVPDKSGLAAAAQRMPPISNFDDEHADRFYK
jgi:hypothetical protein